MITKEKIVFIPLTDEEINKLPFPETARVLGGLLKLHSFVEVNSPEFKEFREQFKKCIGESK